MNQKHYHPPGDAYRRFRAMGKFWHVTYQIPVIQMDKSVKILPTSRTEATAAQALTQGSTVRLFCFPQAVEIYDEDFRWKSGWISPPCVRQRPPRVNLPHWTMRKQYELATTLLYHLILSLSSRSSWAPIHTHSPLTLYLTYCTFIFFWPLPPHHRPFNYLLTQRCL